jgi:hypothetical protein
VEVISHTLQQGVSMSLDKTFGDCLADIIIVVSRYYEFYANFVKLEHENSSPQ